MQGEGYTLQRSQILLSPVGITAIIDTEDQLKLLVQGM